MILASLNTIATVLMNSGLAGFENWWKCALFSCIPILLARIDHK